MVRLNLSFIALVLIHFPLALLMRASIVFSSCHAILVFLIGIYCVLHDKKPERLFYIISYIVGAEVLWRMTYSHLSWEYSKYATVLLLLIATMRFIKKEKIRKPYLIYLALLSPGIIVALFNLPSSEGIRKVIAFNLTGHLIIALSLNLFSRQKFNVKTFGNVLFYLILPITSVLFLSYTGLAGTKELVFTTESSFGASGGFGPNQVSTVLGLGAFLCWILIFKKICTKPAAIIISFIMFGLFTQALLTFSRGGVIGCLISCFIITFYFIRNSKQKIAIVILGMLLISCFYFIIPELNKFTGDMLSKRYGEFDTTGRSNLALHDLQTFYENPLLGVGVGKTKFLHIEAVGGTLAAHTEFTRILAEHGIFGLIAILILFYIIWSNYKNQNSFQAKGIIAAFAVWALFTMAHSALRLGAPSFIIGLTAAKYQFEIEENKKEM